MSGSITCTSNEVCLSLIKVCVASQEQDGVSFCDCSPDFGWTGEDCDEISNALIFNRVAAGVLVLVGIFLSCFSIWLLTVYVKRYKENKSTALWRSVMLLTTISLANLFLIAEFSFDLVIFGKANIFISKDDEIEPKFQDERDLVSLSAILLSIFVVAQNIVVWLSYICELAVYFPEKTVIKGTQMRIGTFVVVSILAVAKIGLFAVGLIDLWKSLLSLLAGIGAIVYTIGYFYLMKYFRNLTKSLDNFSITKVFALITFTYRVNLCATCIICVSAGLRIVFAERNEETLGVGEFNFFVLSKFVSNMCLFIILGSVSNYFYKRQPWKKKTVKKTAAFYTKNASSFRLNV